MNKGYDMSYKIDELFERFPQLRVSEDSLMSAFEIIKTTFSEDGTLFACGNGGSAADAEHIVGELMKGFLRPRKVSPALQQTLEKQYGDEGIVMAGKLQNGFRALSLNGHPSLSTAFANDVDAEMVFAQQLHVLGKPGDTLIGFTTSGNSVNVINAFKIAGVMGIGTIAFTGMDGGHCKTIVDCTIRVPEKETYKAQEMHLPLYHALCAMLEDEFYGS